MQRRIFLAVLSAGLLSAGPLAGHASAQYAQYAQYPYGYSEPGADAQALVTQWYLHFLGRPPDAGSSAWVEKLQSGTAPDAVLAGILGSDEYYRRAGSSPAGFAQKLFTDVTGRPPGPGQLNYLVRRQYTESRQALAFELLARYPGAWQGGGAAGYEYDYRRPSYRYGRGRY